MAWYNLARRTIRRFCLQMFSYSSSWIQQFSISSSVMSCREIVSLARTIDLKHTLLLEEVVLEVEVEEQVELE